MAKPSLSERVVAAVLGSVFGAAIGLAVAWLVGVYSNTLGPGQIEVSLARWVFTSAAAFGALGALLGSAAGTIVGNVIAAIFAFERLENERAPWWVLLLFLAVAAGLFLWFTRGGS